MSPTLVRSERRGALALLTLDRPPLNALDRALLCELEARIAELAQGPGVRAVVLTGAGRAFAAGADIAEMSGMTPSAAEAFSRLGHRVFAALEALPVPSIAAVNGYALGGGCELACACDWIYASAKARFGQPEVNLGIINRVFPPEDLLAGALAVGETIAAKGPLAVAAAKRVMQEGQDVDPRVAHALEQQAFGLVFSTEDRAEGMAAFLEKRDPVFKGK